MTDSEIYDEYEKLWADYSNFCEAANHITIEDAEADDFVRMAIIGFANHQIIDKWRPDHAVIAMDYMNELISEEDTLKNKKFTMLAIGTILGLYSSYKIDERVYRIGLILIPGFIMRESMK